MIDLTPLDVRKKRGDFNKGLRGYDPDEVDSFLELVAERLEHLVKENLTLKERTDRLGDQVRSQEGREKAVQEALVTAQELREDILGQARREADLLQREAQGKADEIRREVDALAETARREAQTEADRIVNDATTRVTDLQETLQELERRRVRFLKSFRALLERELGDVEVEEARTPTDESAIEIDLHGAAQAAGPSPDAAPSGADTDDVMDEDAEALAAEVDAALDEVEAASGDGEAGASSDGDEVVDVRDMAPDGEGGADAEDAPLEGASAEGSNGHGGEDEGDDHTWTSTLVYDEGDDGEGDATARGS